MRPRKEQAPSGAQDRGFVVALARGLEVLRAFGREGEALGNKDFAERTGLSKSTVSRLTYTLHKLGYLHYTPSTARYQLAPSVLSLGFSCLAGMPLRQLAKPYMQEMADRTGLPVALASRDRLAMVYIERCRGANPVTIAIDIGEHIKLSTSSTGRAHIAALTDREREELFGELSVHEGEKWPDIRGRIDAALRFHSEHGYCMSLGEWKPGVNAVAVPLRPRNETPIVVFNCGGPDQYLCRKKLTEEIAPQLKDLVRRIAKVAS